MVTLIVGKAGSGKTKTMIDLANAKAETTKGSLIFINKIDRLMYNLAHKIRVVSVDDFNITNSDEYRGFLYGIISSDHDIDIIYIDSIMKHTDINLSDIPAFIDTVAAASDKHGMDFIVSISAEPEDLGELKKYNMIHADAC
jgi:thymidine kinase